MAISSHGEMYPLCHVCCARQVHTHTQYWGVKHQHDIWQTRRPTDGERTCPEVTSDKLPCVYAALATFEYISHFS